MYRSDSVSFVASQTRVPGHTRLPVSLKQGHGIEAAHQGPLGVADIKTKNDFIAKPWGNASIADAVSRARRRGYALQRQGVAPVDSVRHSLGFAAESDARVLFVGASYVGADCRSR